MFTTCILCTYYDIHNILNMRLLIIHLRCLILHNVIQYTSVLYRHILTMPVIVFLKWVVIHDNVCSEQVILITIIIAKYSYRHKVTLY